MKRFWSLMGLVILALGLVWPSASLAQSESVVQALFFYSPTCPHCHTVIEEVLQPMSAEYGSQLEILVINVSENEGQYQYQQAIEYFQIPQSRLGVPTLIVDDRILVGSVEIPNIFPTLVENGLQNGGIAFPQVPGIDVPESPSASLNNVAGGANLDAASLVTALITLAILLGSLMYAGLSFSAKHKMNRWAEKHLLKHAKTWLVPLLIVAGLGVASYLSYVEVQQVEAVCGPVGDCNTVQGSEYASLFGIPIAVLGLVNYITLGILWGVQTYLADPWHKRALWALVGLGVAGVAFSTYLTSLELFVIQAVCIWCISSALITALLLTLFVVLFNAEMVPQGRRRAR